jgi:hypothetical protein
MNTFRPYFLSYLVVAIGMGLFNHFTSGVGAFPTHTLILQTTMPASELTDKLVQLGVPRDAIRLPMTVTPNVYGATLLFHLVYWAIILSAFVGLTSFFRRRFRGSLTPDNDDKVT